MSRILVTGANGNVGRALTPRLAAAGYELTLALRRPRPVGAEGRGTQREIVVGEISGKTDWREALRECSAVVHLAGQIPARGVTEERFRIVNDEATAQLAEQAAACGVRLFILMSSMAAVTDNASDEVVSDATLPLPVSPYGRSKLAAERHVVAFASSGLAGVSLRPPMIYGASAGGSWGQLQKLAATGLPLPFGAVHNRRSGLSIDNLNNAVVTVISAGDKAPGGAFVVADSDPISLSEMLSLLRKGMGLPPRLVPVPPYLLSGPLRLAGKRTLANSLFGDLVIDACRFREAFGWSPPEKVGEAVVRSGACYVADRRGAPPYGH